MRRHRFLLSFSALLLGASLSLAADKPNFSGTWEMDAAKSDLGNRPLPSKLVRTITQDGDQITMNTATMSDQGEIKTDAKFVADGKTETTNTTRFGPTKSTASWKGDALELVTKLEVQGMAITQSETWTLSSDAKVLTSKGSLAAPQGSMATTLVLNKQPSK